MIGAGSAIGRNITTQHAPKLQNRGISSVSTTPLDSFGIEQLIQEAQQNPATPIIEGFLHEGETSGLHGPTEVFKTMFCMQLTDDLAKGQPFLGIWKTHKPRMIY